eukprot:CAMPEP_0117007568 /NCGR_PEP_ID=MMETSP0472-20121206/7406_1 /TAXON_ID=693140 ORGANISM="Tiarina fusus, Strain LIS" /NCGR_SAMPLE_ID=MMETSP0472 /ASSEMBLY_ACC=CAM_ASM_000603 /LENGTH=587 /DNA_ID=CAMNT_0004709383 /DNA_START=64 /DNA_END=1827 /DNA_ORIENTATION=+
MPGLKKSGKNAAATPSKPKSRRELLLSTSDACSERSGATGGTGKATVVTEATSVEPSVRSRSSRDPPPCVTDGTTTTEPIRADADAELLAFPPRRQHRTKRRTSTRSKDVPKFLQVDQDDTKAAAVKHAGARRSDAGQQEEEEQEGEGHQDNDRGGNASSPKETDAVRTEEETSSSEFPAIIQVEDPEGVGEQVGVSPLPALVSPTKSNKSILKAGNPNEPNAVRTLPAGPLSNNNNNNDGPPCEIHDTIFIRDNDNGFEDDAMTCITMEDFKEMAKKPKRIPKATLRKKKRKSKKTKEKEKENNSNNGGLPKSATSSDNDSRDSSGALLSDRKLSEIVRKDIRSKNKKTLIAGLRAICEMASQGLRQRSKIVHFGALPPILKAIETHQAAAGAKSTTTTDVILVALIALQKIAGKDAKLQEAICQLSGISTIASAMQVNMGNPAVLAAACKTLELITTCMKLPEDFDEEEEHEDEFEDIPTKGAITVLSCCMMAHPKEKDILAYSFCTLVNLCMNRPHMLQMLADSGGVALMSSAVEQKWKSKSRKNQALEDLPIILESVDDDESEDDESESSEEEESDDDDSDAS